MVQDKLGWGFQESCAWLAGQFNIWWPENNEHSKPFAKTIKRVYLHKEERTTNIFDEEVFTWLIENAKLSELAKRFLYEDRFFKEDIVQKLRIKSVSYPRRVIEVLIARFGEERCLKSGLVRQGDYGLYFYFYTPCLLFPYYEQDGRLVGIQSRYLGGNKKAPRFQFLSSQKTRLFNLLILKNLKQGDRLYISEGITDCLALLSAGLNAVAIPSANILPQEDLVMLKNYDLHMYPDQDEAGRKAFVELRRFFVNHFSTLKAEKLPEGVKDYCDYYIKNTRSL